MSNKQNTFSESSQEYLLEFLDDLAGKHRDFIEILDNKFKELKLDFDSIHQIIEKDHDKFNNFINSQNEQKDKIAILQQQNQKLLAQCKALQEELEKRKQDTAKLNTLTKKFGNPETLTLSEISSFFAYLQSLNQLKNSIIIFIASTKTDYKMINAQHALELKNLGLKTDFNDISGRAYFAIIDGGSVMREESCNDSLFNILKLSLAKYKCEINSVGISVLTHYHSKLIINGSDFFIEKCGLNFVIMDKIQNLVVDSVVFGIDNNIPCCTREHFKFRP